MHAVEVASWFVAIGLAGAAVWAFAASQPSVYRRLVWSCYRSAIQRATGETWLPGEFDRDLCSGVRQRDEVPLTWPVAREFEALAHLSRHRASRAAGSDPEWPAFDPAMLAGAYADVAARLRRSFALRIGAPAVAVREASFADAVADRLRRDTGFSAFAQDTRGDVGTSVETLLRTWCETTLLRAPLGDQLETGYDEVVVTVTARVHGPELKSFARLARESTAANWGDIRVGDRSILERRVRGFAAEMSIRPRDFNGRLLRYRDSRLETADDSPHMRLRLLGQQTSFAALVASNLRLHRQPAQRDDDGPIDVPESILLNGDLLLTPWRSPAANALAVHVALVTIDRMLMIVQRAPALQEGGGRFNSAANGLIDFPVLATSQGDRDEHGFVDVYGAAVREMHEEIGRHVVLDPDALMVRGLAVTRETVDAEPDSRWPRRGPGAEQVSPWIAIEARTGASFDEIVRGHAVYASQHDGAYEVGTTFVGLPLDSPHVGLEWCLANADRFTCSGLAGTILTLLPLRARQLREGADFAAAELLEAGVSLRAMTTDERDERIHELCETIRFCST